MDILEKITNSYFKENMSEAKPEQFLDYVYFVLFSSYLKKTFMETRKRYCVDQNFINSNTVSMYENSQLYEKCTDNTDYNYASGYEIADMVKYLSKKQRDIITNYYVLDKPDIEIAVDMKISRQAVYKIRCRALKTMKVKLCQETQSGGKPNHKFSTASINEI